MRLKLSFMGVILVFVFSLIVCKSQQSNQPREQGNNDPLRMTLDRVRQMLEQHYKPKVPIQNYKPLINARFVPIRFDGCTIRWKLVAALGNRGSYILDTTLNLADIDPSDILVLMTDMSRNDRWFFEMRTLHEAEKVKVERIVMNGAKVTQRETHTLSRAAFGADSQETAQQIADDVVSAIKQCSQGQ